MARTSMFKKARYTKLDEGSDVCFFCGVQSSMEDLTPSSGASETDQETFTGEWTRVNSCRACWGKIYTANVAKAGQAFGVRRGLMTLDQKRILIGGTSKSDDAGGSIVLGFDKQWFVPLNTFQNADHFLMGGVRFDVDEILALQPAFGLKYLDRPIEHIRIALLGALAHGSLDFDDMQKYETVLGL